MRNSNLDLTQAFPDGSTLDKSFSTATPANNSYDLQEQFRPSPLGGYNQRELSGG